MKKVFLIAVGFFAFQAASAQEEVSYKPTTGTLTTEVGLSGGLNNANFNLNGGNLKFRYFLKDDIAVRVGLGLENSSKEVITGLTPNKITQTDKVSNNTINLGIEKHFAGSNRLSTYAGADLRIGLGKTSNDTDFEGGNYARFEQKKSAFGAAVFTGADYYIVKNVFLGVEAGLSFMSEKLKDGETSVKLGPIATNVTTPGSKGSTIASNVFGGVRIGFQF